MIVKYTILYDYYGDLLTDKQKKYFEDYYFNNLSLKEIADYYGVSRNAIHNSLRDIIEKLELYEEKLKLYNKSIKIKELIKELNKDLQEKIKELI